MTCGQYLDFSWLTYFCGPCHSEWHHGRLLVIQLPPDTTGDVSNEDTPQRCGRSLTGSVLLDIRCNLDVAVVLVASSRRLQNEVLYGLAFSGVMSTVADTMTWSLSTLQYNDEACVIWSNRQN